MLVMAPFDSLEYAGPCPLRMTKYILVGQDFTILSEAKGLEVLTVAICSNPS